MIRVAAALAALVMLAACNPQPQHNPGGSATPSAAPSGLPPLTITGKASKHAPVSIVQQSGNRKVYRLVAQSVVSHSAQQTVSQGTFKQPTVTFYDKDGTTLTAQAPVATGVGKKVVLSGGVHATTSTGLTLTCDTLTYDQSTALVHGQGHVRITGMQGGERQVLTGNTFTSDVKLTRMVLK